MGYYLIYLTQTYDSSNNCLWNCQYKGQFVNYYHSIYWYFHVELFAMYRYVVTCDRMSNLHLNKKNISQIYIKVMLHMMTSLNGNIFRVTGLLCGEFTDQRCFDVFFDLRLNKRLSNQLWGWWFETPSRPCIWGYFHRRINTNFLQDILQQIRNSTN